jgi:hypothetical protein
VSERVRWSYVQARLQARHGDRLDDAAWRILEAARSFDHFLERSRTTSLHRFTDLIEVKMPSHTIERVLRAAWRDYVAELATWVMPSWQPAVLWIAHFPDLPVLDGLFKGTGPGWAREDPVFAPFARGGLQEHAAEFGASPFARLSPATNSHGSLGAQWLAHWRTLWPRSANRDRRCLDGLVGVVANHFESLARAGLEDSSSPYRHDLEHKATRTFRRCAGTPAALFSHLTLVALDLERLRGGLIRRRLFDAANLWKAA